MDYVYIKSILWTSSNYVYLCSGLFRLKVVNDDHYEKKGCFANSLVTQFLSYKGHLQLTVFI
jgi:hypothetical protein